MHHLDHTRAHTPSGFESDGSDLGQRGRCAVDAGRVQRGHPMLQSPSLTAAVLQGVRRLVLWKAVCRDGYEPRRAIRVCAQAEEPTQVPYDDQADHALKSWGQLGRPGHFYL